MTSFSRILTGLGVALLLVGCGAETNGAKSGDGTPLADSGLLTMGSEGEAVRAVNRYLREYGYLPNSELQHEYPAWRPPVEQAPTREDVYDASTMQGVLALQRAFGLEETGEVDEPSKARMLEARCGVPELGPVDSSAKWDIYQGLLYNPADLTWKVISPSACGLTQAEADAAVSGGLSQWTGPTLFTFTKVGAADAAKIEIRCSSTSPSGGAWGASTLAAARYPQDGSDVWMNSTISWSAPNTPAAGAYDFQSVVTHELGHSLGLAHSSVISTAVMYPSIGPQIGHRLLQTDDTVAALALGVSWHRFDEESYDIDASSNGSSTRVTVTADPPVSGGYTIWQRYQGAWTSLPGQGGVRVSERGGKLWIVQDDGDIYEWLNSQWNLRAGCGYDVAVGHDMSVWIVSCSRQFRADRGAPTGYKVQKWDAANQKFVSAVGGEGAWRISVGPAAPGGVNVPWIVNENGKIYRRSGNSTASGSYAALPGLATDIAVSPRSGVWITTRTSGAGGYEIAALNEQAALANGSPNPVERLRWVTVAGHAVNISVDDSGYPFLVNNAKRAYDTQ